MSEDAAESVRKSYGRMHQAALYVAGPKRDSTPTHLPEGGYVSREMVTFMLFVL